MARALAPYAAGIPVTVNSDGPPLINTTLNDEVHLPLFVRKAHTSSPGAFRSPLTGPIGWIVESRARIALRPVVRHQIGISGVPPVIPPVALAKVSLGDDGRLLGPLGSLGYEGLVVEATGGGHVPRVMVEPLAALARAMPVVLTSRTGSGELLRNTYGFPGSETDLLERPMQKRAISVHDRVVTFPVGHDQIITLHILGLPDAGMVPSAPETRTSSRLP